MAIDHSRIDTPEKMMLLAIIERARFDLSGGTPREADEAEEFLRSPFFERICHLLGMAPEWVRESVIERAAIKKQVYAVRTIKWRRDWERRKNAEQ